MHGATIQIERYTYLSERTNDIKIYDNNIDTATIFEHNKTLIVPLYSVMFVKFTHSHIVKIRFVCVCSI